MMMLGCRKPKNIVSAGMALLVGLAMGTTLLAGCGQANTSGGGGNGGNDTIKIGLEAPMSGDNAQYGEKMKEGVELAFKKINSEGGVNGKKLELVVGDDKATPSEAVAVVTRMVDADHVAAVIGGFNSSPTEATQAVTRKAKVVQLHMGASPHLSMIGNPYLFRVILTDKVYVPVVMNYIVTQKHLKKIAAIYEDTDYGVAMISAAKQSATSLGAELISTDAYHPGDKNFTAQLSKIKSEQPDALLIAGLYNEAALIAQQAHQVGLNAQLFSPSDGVDSEQLIQLGGADVEGYIFASMVDLDTQTPAIQEFKKMAADAHITPEAYTAIAYDAAMVLGEALKESGGDPDKLRDAVAHIKYTGVTGPISFDAQGDRSNKPYIRQVVHGKFVTVQAP